MNELKKLWTLAAPICVTQIAFVAMGVVDTIIAGPLGVNALAALALGNTLYFGLLIFGNGLLLSLDTWVSQAYGGGRHEDVASGLAQGLWLALGVTPVLLLAMWASVPILSAAGYDPALCALAGEYLGPLMWGVLPALLFGAYRGALAAVDVTRPVMYAALAANVANYGLDVWFVAGRQRRSQDRGGRRHELRRRLLCCQARRRCWCRICCRRGVGRRFGAIFRRPDPTILAALIAIGVPVGLQYLLEVWCFSGVTILMGVKGEVPLAAHQIALNVTSVIFMVPLGISSAAAVRCGQALGGSDPRGVSRAGWTAFGSGLAFAALTATTLALFAAPITAVYSPPPDVANLAVSLLGIAAIFQLVDATQAVGIGVLRGLGDTRFPLGVVVFGYGGVALPVGYWLAFVASDAPEGLWWGLVLGLTTVAITLVARFRYLLRHLPTALTSGGVESPWESTPQVT